MSSRALRKLQRQKEQERLAKLEEAEANDALEDEEEEPQANSQGNFFDMLMGTTQQDSENSEHSEKESEEEVKEQINNNEVDPKPSHPSEKKKRKKKKNKKQKEKATENRAAKKEKGNVDEIDLALQELALKSKQLDSTTTKSTPTYNDNEWYSLLSVDSRNLDPLNEMKRLFGSEVVNSDQESPSAGTPNSRRRGRVQHLDLAGALAGRNSPINRGQVLSGLALRKNVFVRGKDDWPQGTGGGLGMEMVRKNEDGSILFKFVHNSVYNDVQRQFGTCVESMDPERLIHLLVFNPYHVSTLLQVSEVAKHQGDHSVAGDLLERALFTFGRSTSSSFASALHEGKARMNFDIFENREFWLAAWRYLNNLGMRGTWRTAYEWAKLLLSLDPTDPYRVDLIIDQLAIRGGQYDHFVKLEMAGPHLLPHYPILNIQISLPLALHKLGDARCRYELERAIKVWPWVFTRLCQELNLEPIPKAIWGKQPPNNDANLFCELYVQRAKDIWNTPEATSLLMEVANRVDQKDTGKQKPPKERPDLNVARHLMLTEDRKLMALLPPSLSHREISASDPFPPSEQQSQPQRFFTNEIIPPLPQGEPPQYQGNIDEAGEPAADASSVANLIRNAMNWLRPVLGTPDVLGGSQGDGEASMERAEDENENEGEADSDAIASPLRPTDANEEERAMLLARMEQLLEAEARLRQEQHQRLYGNEENEAENEMDTESIDPDYDTAPRSVEELEQRHQHWLAGRGMLALRDFTAQHGTDESKWPVDLDYDIVLKYADRLQGLESRQARDFILKYSLTQGTSRDVSALVRRVLDDEEEFERNVGSVV
ncbi:MAG: hypothetical protein M1834_002039 [Cirrosporium novae-zelandiae]|nr:MAG: hypothetical protein M1834_002039 [Cirrosporium novae-zelandiae]